MFSIKMYYLKSTSATRRPTARHACIHGNSFCPQTKMAEEEKSALVSTTKLVIVFLGATPTRRSEYKQVKTRPNAAFS